MLDASGCTDPADSRPGGQPADVGLGGSIHRVLDLQGACNLTLEDLEIRDAESFALRCRSAAVRVIEASLTVRGRVSSPRSPGVGAIGCAACAARSLVIESSSSNITCSTPAHCRCHPGRGAVDERRLRAGVRISDMLFLDNHAESALASDFIRSGAADLNTEGTGSTVALVERTRFLGNTVEATCAGSFATSEP